MDTFIYKWRGRK